MTSTAVRQIPILFSAPMVRAILSGAKSQTRRVVKPQPPKNARQDAVMTIDGIPHTFGFIWGDGKTPTMTDIKSPYRVGDALWVRERWGLDNPEYIKLYESESWRGEPDRDNAGVHFFAREQEIGSEHTFGKSYWRASIHMPKWASRLWLQITDVRVERLQSISEEDAQAEGVAPEQLGGGVIATAYGNYCELWDKINGKKYPWDSNPFVWVISFKKTERPS